MKRIKTAISLVFIFLVAFEGFSQDLTYLEKKQQDALVYPNPLIGQKFIVKSEAVILKVEVVNVIGKVINRTENNNFSIKEMPVLIGRCEKGIYFVKVTFENKKSIIKKLLVK